MGAQRYKEEVVKQADLIANMESVVKADGPTSSLKGILNDQDSETSGALNLVCQQRDRLKRKNRVLEAELVTLGSTIEHVQKQNSQTQKDNVALWERIRFLESNSSSNGRTSGSLKNLKGADVENPNLMRKYKSLHDQSNDLFDQWKEKERLK